MSMHRTVRTLALATCAVATLAGCSSSGNPATHHAPAPTRSGHRHGRAAPQRHLTVDPLTGLRPVPAGPVIAVKVDDTDAGRPQAGLNAADLVYVTQAEGGLTRLVALYAAHRPGTVGPVRSARRDDPELLGQYGSIALASSGGAANELAAVHHSKLVDASALRHPDAYRRLGSRTAPENLMLDVGALAKDVHSASGVRRSGLRFGKRTPRGGRAVHSMTATVGSTPIRFAWNSRMKRWVERRGGSAVTDTAGNPITTRNVIVQFCRVRADRHDIDAAGNPAAFTTSVGSGRVVVLRNGRMVTGRWSRRTLTAPTRYTRAGRPLRLQRGGEWILLAERGSRLHFH